ncbi:uncharacterized protein LOC114753686 [Neltuma alba]|uniref:uncharacterized protein LOC114753686 n=1 Tax=Neltuma alba TaxID=207710 RepID=UPI0010A2C8DD|nr:uncharacterized protein LOC114753686 [Prosopis alba]
MSAPSLSPQHQEGEIQFSRDNHFALHGLITLLTVVLVFFLFIVFIIIIPCLKRSRSASSSAAATSEPEAHEEDEDSRTPSTHRVEENLTQTQTSFISNSSSEVISVKFPL